MTSPSPSRQSALNPQEFASDRINDGCFQGVNGSGYGSSSSLVLDREKGELVEAAVKLERKGVSPGRSIEALKNHSEAERRRARINLHLDTLRSVFVNQVSDSSSHNSVSSYHHSFH
ncbi:hypothetical protein MTR_8g032210 [Medicago truncatula]|uniref:Uncharacterized protein n=1 Tax=Medicago truncatula TaxID=3880 RepID=G7LCM8_MEDTR|nr:hypothetical protein MTR_8g032210 [Medicago truncatula]